MDDLVKKAMQRWPDVPAVFGWLRLDRRGGYHLIDRNAPGFDEARDGLGSPITSRPILDFIGRNWMADRQGRWYWQNGPQRAFANLDLAPLVLRVLGGADGTHIATHTGHAAGPPESAIVFNDDDLFLTTAMGPGLVHDLDLAALDLQGDSLRIAGRILEIRHLRADPAQVLGFVRNPQP